MSTIHPHWQSDEGQPVRVTLKQTAATNQSRSAAPSRRITTVSRRPAALVGIGLALMVLFVVFRPDNGSVTRGQAQNDFKIVLTPDGPIPDKIVAAPGDQIEFLNLFQDPQSIDISQIPTIEGIFETPAIPFQSSFITTIDAYAERGEYTYQGVNSELIQGSVSVEYFSDINMAYPDEEIDLGFDDTFAPDENFPDDDVAYEAAPDEPSFEDLYPYDPNIFPAEGTDENVFNVPSMNPLPTDSDIPGTYPVQALPQNPFTVQYGEMQGSPLPPPYEGFTTPEQQHAGAPLNTLPSRPIHQPATGAGVWMVVFLSAGAVMMITRKAFRRV